MVRLFKTVIKINVRGFGLIDFCVTARNDHVTKKINFFLSGS